MSLVDRRTVLSDLVVQDVPAAVRTTMSEEQLKAVRSAADKRHAVDVRFTVPLLFTRLYIVFLVGRDTRTSAIEQDRERRANAGVHLSTAAIATMAVVAVIAAAVILYVVKSRAGINLFDGHASDILPIAK